MDSKLYEEIGKAVEKAEKNGGDLTTQNLKYVVKVATDMSKKTGVDFDSLFTEGVIAMKKAEEKYDPEQNDNFIKYAGPSVRGYMLNVVNRQNSLVHIPVNHLKGFKKGQDSNEGTSITFEDITDANQDNLGLVYNDAFGVDEYEILMRGLKRLDENGSIAIQMKLHIGKYAETVQSKKNPDKIEYKYKSNIKAIAEELEVPVPMANKIYKSALEKLSKYCKAEING